jgi:hypothetical protein
MRRGGVAGQADFGGGEFAQFQLRYPAAIIPSLEAYHQKFLYSLDNVALILITYQIQKRRTILAPRLGSLRVALP